MNARQRKKLLRQGRCPNCRPRRWHGLGGCFWMVELFVYRQITCYHCGKTSVLTKAKEVPIE